MHASPVGGFAAAMPVLFLAAAALGFTVTEAGLLPDRDLTLGWGLAIAGMALWYTLTGDRPFDLFSPGTVINLGFLVLYGVALVTVTFEPSGPFTEQLHLHMPRYPTVGLISFLGCLGFNLGYRLPDLLPGRRRHFALADFSGAQVFWLWLLMIVVGIMVIIASALSGIIYQTNMLLDSPLFRTVVGSLLPLLYIAVGIALFQCLRQRGADIIWLGLTVISMLILLLYTLPSGSKLNWIVIFIIAAMAFNYCVRLFTRREALLGVAGLLLILSIIAPLNLHYRDQLLRNDASGRAEFGQSFTLLADTFARAPVLSMLGGDGSLAGDLQQDYLRARLSAVGIVAALLQHQEGGGELRYGATYAYTVLAFIPRFLWIEKPEINIGREISQVVLGAPEDDVTSVGVTLVGEVVYNFGPGFTFFVLAAIGVVMKLFYLFFRAVYRTAPLFAFCLQFAFWYALYFGSLESNLASGLSGAVKFGGLLLLLHYLLAARPRPVGAG